MKNEKEINNKKTFIKKKVKEACFQVFINELKSHFKNVFVVSRTQSQLVIKSTVEKFSRDLKKFMKGQIPLSFIIEYSQEFQFNGEFFLLIKFRDPEDHQLRWISSPVTEKELDHHKSVLKEYNWCNPVNPFDRIYYRRELEKVLKRFNLTLTDLQDSLRS